MRPPRNGPAIDPLPGEVGDRVIGPGRAEFAAAMGSPSVVVPGILGQDQPQGPFAEDQHPVGDLGPVLLENRILDCELRDLGCQAARWYSLIRPLRTGFRRTCHVAGPPAAVTRGGWCALSGRRWPTPWCGHGRGCGC